MIERRTFQGAYEFTDSDRDGYLFTRQYMGYTKRQALKLFRQELRGYAVEFWADSFGTWHGRATFPTPLGNTYDANETLEKARKAIARGIRRNVSQRMNTAPRRLGYEVVKMEQTAQNRILAFEMKESEQTWQEVKRDLYRAIYEMKGN